MVTYLGSFILTAFFVTLSSSSRLVGTRHPVTLSSTRDAVLTSTRSVTSLAVAPDGAVWVGTRGGVLQRDRDGRWRKFTRLEGLPSHEVRGIVMDDGAAVIVFPQASAVWREGRWRVKPSTPREGEAPAEPRPALPDAAGTSSSQTCATVWRGVPCVATVAGLHVGGQRFGLPQSKGTHISALLPHGETLWAALFGDGLWAFDGKTWQPLDVGLPPQAREVTAMARDGKTVWVGTRREGVWEYDGQQWRQHLQTDEPYDHNCQALATYRGNLFVSTLEDGLVVRTAEGWRCCTDTVLSSNAPRHLVEFDDALYARHGSGKVDRFDGERWTRDVCSDLPRKQATALAADRKRLYVAQWGGWSEFDGKTWAHHLNLPELQGLPITALYPEGDTLWVGTQGRGLAEVSRPTGSVRWHDERHGLSDDWVTSITRAGKMLCVGTFVGGLMRWDGTRWTTVPELGQESVTALISDGAGGVFIATRAGVWHQAHDGSLEPLNKRVGFLDTETQALCAAKDGLWIGTRTGLYFLSGASLRLSATKD